MKEFSPGPWYIKAHSANSPDEIGAGCDWTVYSIDKTQVCFEGGRTDCAAANARLIAAAPDLLEALQLIASTDYVDSALDPQRAVRVAKAAIQKATGKRYVP